MGLRLRIGWMVLVLPCLAACPPTRDCDVDRDGFDSERCDGGDDCNDATYLVHPGAPEICDGLDNDCDGAVDLPVPSDPPTWYRDSDGDGYGSSDDTARACAAPDGYVNNGLDCDDSRTLVRPGAIEVCDGIDNNCDGEVDEDGAQFALDWWRDADGDGHGNPTSAIISACEAPDGYSGTPDDCDDSEADVHPGADDPCDGRDSDCDGVVEGLWYPDGDADGYGDPAGVMDICDPGDGWVQVGGDCDDAVDFVHPGAEEVCGDGYENDCDGAAPECGIVGISNIDDAAFVTVLGLEPGARLGRSVGTADFDQTGLDGVVVGPEALFGEAGGFWFADPLDAGPTTADADARFEGGPWTSLAAGRDVTGDGIDDLLVGAPGSDRVYLFAGPLEGPLSPDDALVVGIGGGGTDFGQGLALLPDLNGDGIDDIAVGATYIAGGGRVFVFLGGPAPTLDAEDAVMTIWGETWYFGWSILGLPDVSGDGLPEIAVGDPWWSGQSGRVAVFSGLTEGRVDQEDAWSTFSGTAEVVGLGFDLSTPGDLDGDGVPELLAGGAALVGGEMHAVAWVWTPTAGLGSVDSAAVRLVGATCSPATNLNQSHAAPVGDLDGDGIASIAVSWTTSSDAVVALWEVSTLDGGDRGMLDAEAVLNSFEVDEGPTTPRAAALGDQNGDGYDDLIVTEPGRDSASGGFHILLGGPGL